MSIKVFTALAAAARRAEPVALGVISGVKGSSPQKIGAKALFFADGRIESTLGGGCLEAEVQQRAIRSLQTGESSVFDLILDHDFGWDDGLICGGKVSGVIVANAQAAGKQFWDDLAARTGPGHWGIRKDFAIIRSSGESSDAENWLYEETILPPCHLWIAGAGHISQTVAPLATQLDFKVSVFDDRPALANHQCFAQDVCVRANDWKHLLSEPFPASPTFGLIVTRGHRHDALVLREWIQRPFVFLGMIGSSRKARIIFDHFLAEKIATEQQLSRVACPVGLEIQSRSVPEIAVSIMAQLIEKRATHLRG